MSLGEEKKVIHIREKINELLDKFESDEMLKKAYEYLMFIYIKIYKEKDSR